MTKAAYQQRQVLTPTHH